MRRAGRAEAVITAEPSDGEIAHGLAALDQDRHTELALIDDGGDYLIVAGGRGRYHLYLGAIEHDDRTVLQSPEGGDGTLELFVSGRRSTFPTCEVVGLGLAAVAIREFLHSGRPHPQLTWRTG